MNQQSEQNGPPTGKQRLSLQLPAELIEGARDAVYWTPGLTLNELAEVALSHTLACMELLRGGGSLPARSRSRWAGESAEAGRPESGGRVRRPRREKSFGETV